MNTLIYSLIFIAEYFLFLYYIKELFSQKRNKYVTIISSAFCYLILYLVFIFNNLSWIINGVIYIIIISLLLYYLVIIDLINALLNAILLETITIITEIVVLDLYMILTQIIYSHYISTQHLLITLLSEIIFMTFLTIGIVKIRKKHKLFNDNLNKQNIYIYAIPIFTILTLLIHENFEDFEKLNRSQILAFYISSILIFLTNILFFYLFDKLNENQQKFLEFRQREQHQNEYENYNKLVSQQDTAQKILIHDIKNHLRTMQSYQKEGNYELTNSYIASLLGEDSLSKNYSPSKSITFNLLLARYRTICEEAGIDFSLDVMGADIAAVADADITALICNLMDNAISAAEKSEPSFVELSIKQKAESPIQIFSIRNSSDAVPVFDMDGIPLTSKKDSALPHSIGTKSISLVADRYNGHVLYDYNEKTHIFKTVVLLDLEKDIKD